MKGSYSQREITMSYSFSIRAKNKDEAGQKVADEMATVVANQPVHATDQQAVQNAAEAFINMLAEPGENELIAVSIYGSLGWRSENEFTSSSIGVTAGLTPNV